MPEPKSVWHPRTPRSSLRLIFMLTVLVHSSGTWSGHVQLGFPQFRHRHLQLLNHHVVLQVEVFGQRDLKKLHQLLHGQLHQMFCYAREQKRLKINSRGRATEEHVCSTVSSFTFVQFEDGVGHGRKDTFSFQDVNVPNSESQRERRLRAKQKRKRSWCLFLCSFNNLKAQRTFVWASITAKTTCMSTKAPTLTNGSKRSQTNWRSAVEVGACLCLFTYSVQETLKEPLHGVKIGVNFLVVLKHKQPKHTVSRCFTASHSWTDLYKQETELTVPQQNPKKEIRDLELTGSNVLCVTVDFGVRRWVMFFFCFFHQVLFQFGHHLLHDTIVMILETDQLRETGNKKSWNNKDVFFSSLKLHKK